MIIAIRALSRKWVSPRKSAVVFGPRAAPKGRAVAAILSSFREDAHQLLDLIGLRVRLDDLGPAVLLVFR
jgi:hypothetical protein